MKKILAVSIVLFSVFMSYVVIGGFLQKQSKEAAPQTTTAPATNTTPATSNKSYAADQVAAHNSSSDCWLIINNNVYDVTSFLADHPGGASTILPYCGKEATKAFDTQDRGSRGGHSSNAASMLADYQIGTLK